MAARRAGLLCLPAALLLLLAGGRARAAGAVPASSSEAFDSVLGNTASCHRACQLTYSLHTYPKVRLSPASRLGPAPLSFLPARLTLSPPEAQSAVLRTETCFFFELAVRLWQIQLSKSIYVLVVAVPWGWGLLLLSSYS